MKKRLVLPVVVAALAMFGTTNATASPGIDAPRQASVGTAAASCSGPYSESKAITNVKIRKKPRTNATALRLWYKKTKGCATNGAVVGDFYGMCGGDSSPHWRKVKYRGTTGYVPMSCLR
ncbi:hypothetical protein [Streptomyces sp. NPDC002564]|uniref:hypothetical protein n=1 Tax=Streptomyces sp. NPDC002564 TaxID=3364649 RepID=UPI0036B3370C